MTSFADFCLVSRDYIQRAFQACTSDAERNTVEQYLRVEITATLKDKRAMEIDWYREPLPL